MIRGSLACVALFAAFWRAWFEIAARLTTAETLLPLAMAAGVSAAPAARRLLRGQPLGAAPALALVALLAIYVTTSLAAPALISAGAATIAMLIALHFAGRNQAPQFSLVALTALALPVLPTLEFYLGYPLREASAWLSVEMLRAQGLAVSQDGVALRIGAQLVQFDAPCAGVRMLWTASFLCCAGAYLRGLKWQWTMAALTLGCLSAVLANAVRAAGLVYIEAGLLPIKAPLWAHEGAGLVAFTVTAALLVWTVAKLPARRAPV